MECENIKKILLEEDPNSFTKEEVQLHVENCKECKALLNNVNHSNLILTKLKRSIPVLEDPDSLSNSILNEVKAERRMVNTHHSFGETLLSWFMLPQMRLALYSLIIFFVVIYSYEEVTALKSVVTLENNLKSKGVNYEAGMSDNMPNLSLLYDLYKILAGEKKHLKLTEEWLLVNKEFLRKLFAEYNSLTPEKKKEFEELRKTFTKEQNEFVDDLLNNKNKSLK